MNETVTDESIIIRRSPLLARRQAYNKKERGHIWDLQKKQISEINSQIYQLEEPQKTVVKGEVERLEKLVIQERSHGQWKKQFFNLFNLACLIVLNLLRSGSFKIGFDKCSAGDWTTVAVYCVLSGVLIWLGCRIVAEEQALKAKYGGINLDESDLRFEGKTLWIILVLSFGGGFVAGAFGLGGGAIYNPLLLSMGVPPKVAASTGLYLVTFSKISACLIYYLEGEFTPSYAFWVASWSVLGSVIGVLSTRKRMDKSGRQSIIVLFLVIILLISVIGIPIFGAQDLIEEKNEGYDILAFRSICGDE